MDAFEKIIFVLLGISIFLSDLRAADISYSAGVGLDYYQNVRLIPDPQRRELSKTFRGDLSYIEDVYNVESRINASINIVDYQENQIADRVLGDLIADSLWKIKPGYFEWSITDIFRQTSIDSFLSGSVSNQQNANIFSTGPNYTIRMSSRSNLRLEGRFIYNSYDVFINNKRYLFTTRFQHRLSPGNSIGLNYEAESVSFSENGSVDYKRRDLFINMDYIRGLNSVASQVGVSRIVTEDSNKYESVMYSLALRSARTRTSVIGLEFENILSDTGRQLLSSGNTIPSATVGNTLSITSGDTYINKRLRLSYNKVFSHGMFNAYATQGSYDYTVQDNLSREFSEILLSLRLDLNPRMYVVIDGVSRSTKYLDQINNRMDDDDIYSVSYIYLIQRNIDLRLKLLSQTRDSSLNTANYDDVRFSSSFEYRF